MEVPVLFYCHHIHVCGFRELNSDFSIKHRNSHIYTTQQKNEA